MEVVSGQPDWGGCWVTVAHCEVTAGYWDKLAADLQMLRAGNMSDHQMEAETTLIKTLFCRNYSKHGITLDHFRIHSGIFYTYIIVVMHAAILL